MRLLHTKTQKLHWIHDKIPNYIILAHTWGVDEISSQELQTGTNKHKAGWKKVDNFCMLAKKLGYDFAWIDTCCFENASSSELQETITSFGQYYADAPGGCIAYLEDVDIPDGYSGAFDIIESTFRKSKFFARGWTLQELVLPKSVTFYGSDWQTTIGTRANLAEFISSTTGIPMDLLKSSEPYKHLMVPLDGVASSPIIRYCAQNIFSWAAAKQTLRREDEAYCTLGLLKLTIPILYGEHHAAFVRLLKEFIKECPDESIFVWEHEKLQTLLAPAVQCFKHIKPWLCRTVEYREYSNRPYVMTNKGLYITRRLYVLPKKSGLKWEIRMRLLQHSSSVPFEKYRWFLPLQVHKYFGVVKPEEEQIALELVATRTGMKMFRRGPVEVRVDRRKIWSVDTQAWMKTPEYELLIP